jgi:hypothetical protein
MAAVEILIVTSIVVVCALYSGWRLTPARFHLRVLDLLGKAFGSEPGAWVTRMRNRELSKLGGSCGACSSNVKLKVHSR